MINVKNILKPMAYMMFALLVFVHNANAEDSTPEQAEAHAQKAAQFVRDNGAEAALVEFNKKEGEFVQGDLYVFAIDKDGVFTAHPIKPALVGKNMMALKDVEGTPLVKNFTEVEGEGWSPYKWPHPVTKQIRPKKSYIINVDGVILGVGAYY